MDDIIQDILNKHLYYWKDGNSKPGEVHPEMREPGGDYTQEWKNWIPIESKVTDDEIADFENYLGHNLPEDYKTFLKFKHFYELNIGEAGFCAHPVYTWRKELSDMIFDGYPREYMIDKGLIPFANWSDWGHLCFDTNNASPDDNYEVVLWDHEMPDTYSRLNKYSKTKLDFKALLILCDKEDDEMKKEMDQDLFNTPL